MRAIATEVVCILYVGTTVSLGKMTEPIEMPFGKTMGPKNHVMYEKRYKWAPPGKYD